MVLLLFGETRQLFSTHPVFGVSAHSWMRYLARLQARKFEINIKYCFLKSKEGKVHVHSCISRIAFVVAQNANRGYCLMGQIFGTSMLIVGPLSMMMLPMTQEFGWSRSQLSYATSAVM